MQYDEIPHFFYHIHIYRIPTDFANSIHNCYAEYSELNEDHETFGLRVGTA